MFMNIHPTVEKLLAEIEAFRDRTGLNPTKFGQLSVNDGNFIRAIRSGVRTPSLATIDRVRQFMREYKRRAA